ncbi:MAG: prephenate dehydratase [Raoultibacter sp.]|jgi:prephenate dehydratase
MTDTRQFAYLGPAGTYSDEAARTFATRLGIAEPKLFECSSFDEIFDCVERGRCEFGVVPTENSLEGAVTSTLDNFAFKNNVEILGEEILDIHHCLLLNKDASIGDIDTIASHAQGIAQCRRYIAEHLPGKNVLTTSSTAESARLAADNKNIASIANAFASSLYGTKVFGENIEDHFDNQTSFALIGRQGSPQVFEGDSYKTSLALFLQANKAGALLMILSEFAYGNINLTKIQSRPTKQALGDYMFFVDLDGSVNDPTIQTALNCLRLKLREVKVLGSYPV